MTDDGRPLILRPVIPTDIGLMRDFLARLSPGSRYFRFGQINPEVSEDLLNRLCSVQAGARLLVTTELCSDEIQIAYAGYQIRGEEGMLDIVVSDAWHGMGISSWLMATTAELARSQGLSRLAVNTLTTNRRMLRLAKRFGYMIDTASTTAATVRMVRNLWPRPESRNCYPADTRAQ